MQLIMYYAENIESSNAKNPPIQVIKWHYRTVNELVYGAEKRQT